MCTNALLTVNLSVAVERGILQLPNLAEFRDTAPLTEDLFLVITGRSFHNFGAAI